MVQFGCFNRIFKASLVRKSLRMREQSLFLVYCRNNPKLDSIIAFVNKPYHLTIEQKQIQVFSVRQEQEDE